MPRRKKMPGIGQWKKRHSRRKKKSSACTSTDVTVEHNYSHQFLSNHDSPEEAEQVDLWAGAWGSFYLGHDSEATNSSLCEVEEVQDSDGCSANEFWLVLHKVFRYSHEDDLETVVDRIHSNRRYELFHILKNDVVTNCMSLGGFRICNVTEDLIKLVQFYEEDSVKLSLTITPSLVPTIRVHRILLDRDHDVWTGLPRIVTSIGDLKKYFARLELWDVCVGNYEKDFTSMMPISTTAHSKAGDTVAYHEGDFCAVKGDINYHSTVRSTKCWMLTIRRRCLDCAKYRHTLTKKHFREKKSRESTFAENKHTPHKHMSKGMMIEKIGVIKDHAKDLQSELDRMRRKIGTAFCVEGQQLSDMDNSELLSLLNKHNGEVETDFPDSNSLPRLFWDQQIKYARLQNKKQMRWHPMIIKWCLYMRSKSQVSYDTLRETGFVSLPSSRTLFDYSHWLPAEHGYNLKSVAHLRDEAKKMGMFETDWKSYVGILQDEVKVSEGLVYDRVSGELVGYVELNKTGNELLHLGNLLQNNNRKLATTVLVVMVRGITSSLKYPIASFATTGVTGDFLYSIIWNTIEYLVTECKLKVLFVTCDGATPNRNFFALHHSEQLQNTYWTWNRYSYPRRKLYFISDVPHLLKTTRNCFANSGSHNKSRDL